jgi:branched-subunit amino acid ABC-type transport system permease component
MLMVRSIIQFSWGVNVKTVNPGIQRPIELLGAINILPRHLIILGVAIGLVCALHIFLTSTKIGKAMRAMSDAPVLARLTGIDTERVVQATWVVGALLACVAGILLATDTQIDTQLGYYQLLPMFAAAILGGLGKPYGAAVGGIVVGLVEEISVYPWLGSGPLFEPGYKSGVAFMIMIAILLWRPTGLFKGRTF